MVYVRCRKLKFLPNKTACWSDEQPAMHCHLHPQDSSFHLTNEKTNPFHTIFVWVNKSKCSNGPHSPYFQVLYNHLPCIKLPKHSSCFMQLYNTTTLPVTLWPRVNTEVVQTGPNCAEFSSASLIPSLKQIGSRESRHMLNRFHKIASKFSPLTVNSRQTFRTRLNKL